MKAVCASVSMATVLCFGFAAASLSAQTAAVPPGATRVNDNYQPDPNGNWWMINNFVDTTPVFGVLNLNDTYNFQENLSGPPI